MKLKIFTFLSICILYLNISMYANQNYEIATWFDFKQSALTYTYDDNTPNQVNVAIPLMDEFNFKGTFYVVTGWSPNWTAFQQASNNGHEIGGHTVSHPHFNELSDDELTTEIVNSQTIINENIQGESCVTIAYPFCETGNIDIISAHYIAGRVCDARIEPATPNNFYEISSIVCGTEGLNTPQALNNKANETKEANGWNVFLMHGIDNDQGTYSPIASSTLKEHFEYVAQNDKDYWVAPFRDVVKYIKLRNDVTIEEDSVSQDSLMIMLSTTLDSEIYDTEISFRRAIPNEWKFINVYSKSGNKTFHVSTIDNQKYITIHSNVDNNDTIFVVNDIVTSGATYPPSVLLQHLM
jgi:peptidoglycan/xylan/chitin deacetylase (PgdA/CDA1 family)